MFSTRLLGRLAMLAGAIGLALPAAAGTLAPRLRTLAASYRAAPRATIQRLAATGTSPARFLSPHVNAAGQVQVYLHYGLGQPPSRAALERLGASGVRVSRALGVVQAWVPIARLHAAAALAGTERVDLPVYGYAKGNSGTHPATDSCSAVPAGLSIDHQGIAAEKVGPVHRQGIKGAGVKVGVISNGADCISSSQAAGYLPSSVFVPSASTGSGDEGTAMLEEVHAMAPDAALGFCSGNTTVDFLNCLGNFAGWGAHVISDDIGFYPVAYNFPAFQATDGGNAITEFAQAHPDITLTSAAGNDREDYFEDDYKAMTDPSSPTGVPISLSPTYTPGGPLSQYAASGRSYKSAMNFGAAIGKPNDAAMTVQIFATKPDTTLVGDLTWNDPANGPYDDLDLFLLKSDGTLACQPASDGSQWCSSSLDQTTYGSQGLPPLEFVEYTNDTDRTQTLYLVALCFKCSAHGSSPLHVKLYGFMNGGGTFNYTTDGGIYGHAALPAELAAAAARYGGSGVSSTIEDFSDSGPFGYGDWASGAKTRQKPDMTGIDGVTISGAGGFAGGGPFYGTSAASPNIGAVIALLRSFAPNGEPDAAHWKQLVMDHASPDALTNYTRNRGGAGLADAEAALGALDLPISVAITEPTGSPAKVAPDTGVQFKATCDYSGSSQLNYKWSFGKAGSGAPPDATGLAPAPVQYANGGVYTATFTCTDSLQSKSAQQTIAVEAAASAADVSVSTGYETAVTGQFKGSDIGGEKITYEVAAQPKHGSVTTSGSSFTYTPDDGFGGTDSFTYDIDNGVKKSDAATVTVTVAEAPPPPPPPPRNGGGGGAFGGLGLGLLAALGGLAFLLRRRH